jgi:hypothetical protein
MCLGQNAWTARHFALRIGTGTAIAEVMKRAFVTPSPAPRVSLSG